MLDDLEALQEKTTRNELRAKDAEARLRIIEAEIAIIHKRKELLALKDQDDA
ncbi:hypothetical protein [Tropicibacter naphthalenivorans]|uniref:Uncharacterized protein n=1 Tax=Tropicibacter naphthalenivorans TaxID=441103 RepID=A0A0P1H0L0_9RHOB|nr:hypothetical protein [Tropicibacter naphthalenivorans]CUH82612.1 hypothetical protein TRN7648_04154 [Tropicibacter naphthalenivorans]SMD08850.1 hypothetical protein SAMN04488093_1183 [Tropicibacter naphthalenivorans]